MLPKYYICGMNKVKFTCDQLIPPVTFMDESIRGFVEKINLRLDQELLNQLKKLAQPKIKGPLTAGKLKWRGIKIEIINVTPFITHYNIIQRGVQVGDTIIVNTQYAIS